MRSGGPGRAISQKSRLEAPCRCSELLDDVNHAQRVQRSISLANYSNVNVLIVCCGGCGRQSKIVITKEVNEWSRKYGVRGIPAKFVTEYMEVKYTPSPASIQRPSGKPSSGKSKPKGKYEPCRTARLE